MHCHKYVRRCRSVRQHGHLKSQMGIASPGFGVIYLGGVWLPALEKGGRYGHTLPRHNPNPWMTMRPFSGLPKSVHIAQSRKFAGRSHPFAHYSHSHRIVFTAILTLFSHYSHGLTLFAHCSHGRTLLIAHYSHGRTRFARSHTIRTPFARSHTIRAVHTLFAPSSHQIRTLFAPVRTPVTLFARWGRARSHSFTQYSHSSHPFAFVNVR